MYIDVEAVLVTWLAGNLGVRCVTELPANLQDVLPVVRVVRVGGTDRVPSLDRAVVDVDFYDADRPAAILLARRGHAALRFELPGSRVAGGVVSMVGTVSAPSWRPYDDTALRRFGGSYEITLHSQSV